MFRIVVGLTVMDRSCRSTSFERHATLPFAPFLGLEMGWLDRHQEGWSGVVDTVIWDATNGRFVMELEDWVSDDMDLPAMVAAIGPEWRSCGGGTAA